MQTAVISSLVSLASCYIYFRLAGPKKKSKPLVWSSDKGTIGESQNSRTVTMRLKPGQDPRIVLKNFAIENNISAATIVSCVGSLTKVHLRYADSVTKQV